MVAASAAKNVKILYCCCQCRETRRRIHFPLLVRASAFKLSARCLSHTNRLLTCCSCDVMYGRNTSIVNKKMSAKSVRNMLTIAALSRMTNCTSTVLYGNEIFQAATQIRVYFTFIRCCHLACLVVQCYKALGMIFGLLCNHVPST